jgi:phosphate transport system permease protein
MENIQQAAKPSAMMNEAPMNHLTLSDRLKSYKRTPGSFLVMLLVVLSAVATIAALVFLILYIFYTNMMLTNFRKFSFVNK